MLRQRYVSPRRRAQRTLELLDLGCHDRLPWQADNEQGEKREKGVLQNKVKVEITEDIREWGYGDYEGLTSAQIRELRESKGQSEAWDIWRHGCPGGECVISVPDISTMSELITDHCCSRSPDDITERLDRVITDIRSRFHSKIIGKTEEKDCTGDVLLVAHGHILRAFAMRWIGRKLSEGVSLILEGTQLDLA